MLAVGGPNSDGDTHSVTLCSLYEVHIKIARDKCLEQKDQKHYISMNRIYLIRFRCSSGPQRNCTEINCWKR